MTPVLPAIPKTAKSRVGHQEVNQNPDDFFHKKLAAKTRRHEGPLLSQGEADLAQILQNFPVGLEEGSFVILNRLLSAEFLYDFFRFSQPVSRHFGEQVMFYLIVEAAKPEVQK